MTAGDRDTHETETEDGGPDHVPSTDPSTVEDEQVAALAALGNERRLEILLALGDRERETRVDRYELSFTELYDAEVETDRLNALVASQSGLEFASGALN
jgi:DNA-binding transcriptional ArsR family regulator